jgi:hypothetical protein
MRVEGKAMTTTEFTKEDIVALSIFVSAEARPEDWTLDDEFERDFFTGYDYEGQREEFDKLYARGKKLHEAGYYVAHSTSGPNPYMDYTVEYPNGQPVPDDKLASKKFLFEGGYVAQSRSFYAKALVLKQD